MSGKTAVHVGVSINPHDIENRYEITVVKDTGETVICPARETDPDVIIVRVAGQTPHDAINRLRDALLEKELGLLELPTADWWADLETKNSMVC